MKRSGRLSWRDEFNFGVDYIDEQHRYFFDIMVKIEDCLDTGDCMKNAPDIFFSLARYAEHYIMQEEIYFKDYKFPGHIRHKVLHQDFINRIILFQKDFENGTVSICKQILEFLEDWFENHILKYDKQAIDYLRQQGL